MKKANEEKAKAEKVEAQKKAKEIEAKKGYTKTHDGSWEPDTYFQTFAKKLEAEAAKKEADALK